MSQTLSTTLLTTLFIRRYPDGLTVTAHWRPQAGAGFHSGPGELELVAECGEDRLDSERHRLDERCLPERERRATALANQFVQRARRQAAAAF